MLGYKRKPSETYHELAERIRQNEIPIRFIEIYERILYGTLEIDEKILHATLEERAQLLENLQQYKRKTYLLCRLRLYIVRYR